MRALLRSLPFRFVASLLCVAAPFAPTAARSQPSPEDEQIAKLTRKLEKNARPQSAARLYADRADAYRARNDLARTEQDARAAVQLCSFSCSAAL